MFIKLNRIAYYKSVELLRKYAGINSTDREILLQPRVDITLNNPTDVPGMGSETSVTPTFMTRFPRKT